MSTAPLILLALLLGACGTPPDRLAGEDRFAAAAAFLPAGMRNYLVSDLRGVDEIPDYYDAPRVVSVRAGRDFRILASNDGVGPHEEVVVEDHGARGVSAARLAELQQMPGYVHAIVDGRFLVMATDSKLLESAQTRTGCIPDALQNELDLLGASIVMASLSPLADAPLYRAIVRRPLRLLVQRRRSSRAKTVSLSGHDLIPEQGLPGYWSIQLVDERAGEPGMGWTTGLVHLSAAYGFVPFL